jgi:predicted DCC family thiol-disulfide oxidoreductase YuxK
VNNIVIYDGLCNLCCSLTGFIRNHAGKNRFTMVSRYTEAGEKLLRSSDLKGKDLDTLIYYSGGRYYLRSSAVIRILKDMGGLWKLFYPLKFIPAFIRDFFYLIVAKTRYRIFGKTEGC